jgi:acetyltransferase-like isoleucine patch superfamily enzyme
MTLSWCSTIHTATADDTEKRKMPKVNILAILSQRLRNIHIYFFIWNYRRQNNITLDGKLILSGIPCIRLHKQASLRIGDNVTLTSSNMDYHLSIFTPTKILADRQNASISIGEHSRIHGTCIHATKHISIGANCLIAANTQIMDSNGHQPCFDDVSNRIRSIDIGRPVIIEDDVWIGTGAVVLPGAKIGRGSIIGAMSVVRGIIPSYCVAVGNPAVVVKHFAPNKDPSQ